MGVKRTLDKSQHTKLNLEKKILQPKHINTHDKTKSEWADYTAVKA